MVSKQSLAGFTFLKISSEAKCFGCSSTTKFTHLLNITNHTLDRRSWVYAVFRFNGCKYALTTVNETASIKSFLLSSFVHNRDRNFREQHYRLKNDLRIKRMVTCS